MKCSSCGGMVNSQLPSNKSSISRLDASEIAKSIRAKKMASGGLIEDSQEDDFSEMPENTEADDFLSDEPIESEESKKKARMVKVMANTRSKRISL